MFGWFRRKVTYAAMLLALGGLAQKAKAQERDSVINVKHKIETSAPSNLEKNINAEKPLKMWMDEAIKEVANEKYNVAIAKINLMVMYSDVIGIREGRLSNYVRKIILEMISNGTHFRKKGDLKKTRIAYENAREASDMIKLTKWSDRLTRMIDTTQKQVALRM